MAIATGEINNVGERNGIIDNKNSAACDSNSIVEKQRAVISAIILYINFFCFVPTINKPLF